VFKCFCLRRRILHNLCKVNITSQARLSEVKYHKSRGGPEINQEDYKPNRVSIRDLPNGRCLMHEEYCDDKRCCPVANIFCMES
jgi:hypothetical protein